MQTDLDCAHDWQLSALSQENSNLNVSLFETINSVCVRKANVLFEHFFLYLNVEEVLDAWWGQELPDDEGFIKKYPLASSALAKKLNYVDLSFYEMSHHYKLITRDEIIHVFSNLDPIITVTESV
jgi:hypothetical protein